MSRQKLLSHMQQLNELLKRKSADTIIFAVTCNGCAGSMGAWGGVTGRGYALAPAKFFVQSCASRRFRASLRTLSHLRICASGSKIARVT